MLDINAFTQPRRKFFKSFIIIIEEIIRVQKTCPLMSGILKNEDPEGLGIRITEIDVMILRKKRIDSWQNWKEM